MVDLSPGGFSQGELAVARWPWRIAPVQKCAMLRVDQWVPPWWEKPSCEEREEAGAGPVWTPGNTT